MSGHTRTLPEDLALSLAFEQWTRRYCLHGVYDWERKHAADNLLAEVASTLHKFAMHSRDPLALGLEDPIDQLNNIRHDIKGINTDPDDSREGMRERAADLAAYHARVL